jgi:electron transfer flavoprotein beta subunit
MTDSYHIVVCGSLVPDPLQTLEPAPAAPGAAPTLKNENMLPSVLDPWAAHALYEAAALARNHAGSKVWLVSLGPRARLQQLMMQVAQKVPFELVALDGPASGFTDAVEVAGALASAIEGIPDLDRDKLVLCGGCASASRDAGVTIQMVAEQLGIQDQFLAVDELQVQDDGWLRVLERLEGGNYLASVCEGPPLAAAWATGTLPEPPNSPQVGMQNMRAIMPALQKATPAAVTSADIAREIVDWIKS